jgi:hypothetical protein
VWTDLGVNLILLMMSDYVLALAISNVGHIIVNFLNLDAGWIHRLNRPDWGRPWKSPNWLLAMGGVPAFVSVLIMGVGAGIWGPGTLVSGLVFTALIVPVFWFRHYVQDNGTFPPAITEDMHLFGGGAEDAHWAGGLPWIAVAGGVLACILGRSQAASAISEGVPHAARTHLRAWPDTGVAAALPATGQRLRRRDEHGLQLPAGLSGPGTAGGPAFQSHVGG